MSVRIITIMRAYRQRLADAAAETLSRDEGVLASLLKKRFGS
jgi:hypothetical protein